MKQIPLTQGKVAIVDDEDYEELIRRKWCAYKHGLTFYGKRRPQNGDAQYIHRAIMGNERGVEYDHIDGNGLNNQRSNLRAVTHQQNMMNQKSECKRSSQFKGVIWSKENKKWLASIRLNNKSTYLGLFNDEEKAARAYDAKARELCGEYARLNFNEEKENKNVNI